jgi:putative endonuclease
LIRDLPGLSRDPVNRPTGELRPHLLSPLYPTGMDVSRKTYAVYILTNRHVTTLYVGVTGDLARRIYEHKTGAVDGFTKRYNVNRLVYAEEFSDVRQALDREKQLKNWKRAWKIDLIRSQNPDFDDLSDTVWG